MAASSRIHGQTSTAAHARDKMEGIKLSGALAVGDVGKMLL
jgi:hypothetical protein